MPRYRWPPCGLRPNFPQFSVANPSIEVRLSSVIWDNAALDEATDLEVRYGAGHWHGYRSERLLNQNILPVCSPTLLRAAQVNSDPAALLPRHLIHIMGYENHWLKVRQTLELADFPASECPTVDTTHRRFGARGGRRRPSRLRTEFFWTRISRRGGW